MIPRESTLILPGNASRTAFPSQTEARWRGPDTARAEGRSAPFDALSPCPSAPLPLRRAALGRLVIGRALSSGEIIATVEVLTRRIEERFPDSKPGSFGAELEQVAREADETTAEIRRPLVSVRAGVTVAITCMVGVLAWILARLFSSAQGADFGEGIQSLEAALSSTFLWGPRRSSW